MVPNEHNEEFGGHADARFDATLKQYVRRRAESVSAPPCAGLDADTAAAYLEGALTPAASLRYDEHLAACASCRRHLVEMSRLMPQPAAEAASSSVAPSSASFLKEKLAFVSQWLNFSGGRWGAVAGVGAAGFAVLLAVITLGPLQRSRDSEGRARNVPAARGGDAAAPLPSRGGEAQQSKGAEDRLRAQLNDELLAHQRRVERSRSATNLKLEDLESMARTPATVSGKVSDATGAAVPNAEVKLIDPASQRARSTTTNEAGEFNFPNVPPARYVVEAQAPGFVKQQNVTDAQNANEVVAFQLRPGAASETVQVTTETQLSKDKAEVATLSEPERARQQRREADLLRLGPGVVPPEEKAIEARKRAAKEGTKDERERGGQAAQQESLADAARGDQKNAKVAGRVMSARAMSVESREAAASKPAPPTRKVGDKTFRLESGVWVDIQYKPADNLPVTRLPYSGEEFNRAISEHPGLKPFLELKPVIVVWQGRVYQVEGRK